MEKIKVGFVGAGGMGTLQMKNLVKNDDVEITALYESDAKRGKAVLKDLGIPGDILVDDYDKIVENPDIDAVWLVSPNGYHGPQSIKAMEAGKHVFCEKPCAVKFDEFCRQIDLERDNPDLKTQVNYLMYFDPLEDRVKSMVAEGAFGMITQIQINYRYPIATAGTMAWKLKKDIMGDSIGMGTVHALSSIINIMSPQTKPAAVFATNLGSQVKGFEAEPIYNILIKFDNGAAGFCFGNIESSGGLDIYHNLSGTKGGFVFDPQAGSQQDKVRYRSEENTKGEWVWPLNKQRCIEEGFENLVWGNDTPLSDSSAAALLRVGESVNHFIDSVKTGNNSFLSFDNSSVVAEIGWAAQMSAASGREIPLPLDRETAKEFFL